MGFLLTVIYLGCSGPPCTSGISGIESSWMYKTKKECEQGLSKSYTRLLSHREGFKLIREGRLGLIATDTKKTWLCQKIKLSAFNK